MSKANRVTQRGLAVAIFNAMIPRLDTLGAKEFRASVRGKIMTKTGVDDASASAMYNYAKNRAVGTGEVAQFGRSTKTGLASTSSTPVRGVGDNWAVVNKETGEVVGYAKSRAIATKARADGQTVKKADAVA